VDEGGGELEKKPKTPQQIAQKYQHTNTQSKAKKRRKTKVVQIAVPNVHRTTFDS
jgi:hypothetical protein